MREFYAESVCKKPSLDYPEDVVGSNGCYYWLLDGATPPAGDLSHRHTLQYVHCLSAALAQNSLGCPTTQELLYRAIADVRKEFHQYGLDANEYQPSSTAIVVAYDGHCIRYSVLGDSILGLRVNLSKLYISDSSLKRIAIEQRTKVRTLRAQGVNEESEQYLCARKQLIAEEQRYQNVPGGYWIACLNPEAAYHSISGEIPVEKNDQVTIIGASDGLERLVSHLGRYESLLAVADSISMNGEGYVFSELRRLENSQRDFIKPVSSRHDDASFFLLRSVV